MQPTPPKAVIYCRLSTSQHEDWTSLDTQEEQCHAYAARQGYHVVGAVHDPHSGDDPQRTGLSIVRDWVRSGRVQRVIMSSPDRLSREPKQLPVLLGEIAEWDVPVEFAAE
jgi:DNA invertase Pin-like site-specific DNA recombinase